MYRLLVSTLALTFLTACSLTNEVEEQGSLKELNEVQEPNYIAFQEQYMGRSAREPMVSAGVVGKKQQGLNFFVRGMMQQLVNNMQYVSSKTAMAVTSFVFLDGSYEHADIVGKQLSESFIHEVHKYGIPIVDFKATDYIRITQNGDFVLSKDFLDLDGDLPVKYVLTGTMLKQTTGYTVNVRVVGMKSKAIVATAQGYIPIAVITSMVDSENSGQSKSLLF